jgi:hypothetical protein
MNSKYQICPEAESILQQVAAAHGVTPGAALSEAISLLHVTWQAQLYGKRLVIVDQEGNPESEVTLEFANDDDKRGEVGRVQAV